MGTGRGRAALSWVASRSRWALIAGGCGAEDHPNEPRPPQAIEVTVSINDTRLSVQPREVGFGESDQPMSQNTGQPQAELSSSIPLTVSFTVSNLTDFDTHLQIEGPADETTRDGDRPAARTPSRSNCPTGEYLIYAAGVPGRRSPLQRSGRDRPSRRTTCCCPSGRR